MITFKTSYIMYAIASILCTASVAFHSAAFAACAVVGLFGGMIQEGIEHKLLAMKDIKLIVPKQLQDDVDSLKREVATIAFGIKSRGF